jgi:glycosyltransferase involved in cell wall biosynthesis
MREAPILLDVSRLIWRQWTRRLPTGIDRVCLAYLKYYRSNARAVVQFRQVRRILDSKASNRLFNLLLDGSSHFRSDLIWILATSGWRTENSRIGQIYLNVGHTGLNSSHFERWLADRQLRPVYLIHDLIPITHPQYCREGEATRHQLRIAAALRSASGLITNSAATKHDLADFARDHGFTMPPHLIAWLGTDRIPLPPADPTGRGRPYFVIVGTIEARKNHLTIIRAWREIVARMGDQAPHLIVIGQRGWEAAESIAILDDLGPLEGRVTEKAACDDKEMHELLAGAQAILMPSFVEGFGLPVVEALQQGVPVIASDLPVFREIVGDIPTYVDPNDRCAWEAAVLGYLGNGVERKRQLDAISNFRAPQWADHFAQVEKFLDGLRPGPIAA